MTTACAHQLMVFYENAALSSASGPLNVACCKATTLAGGTVSRKRSLKDEEVAGVKERTGRRGGAREAVVVQQREYRVMCKGS